MRSICSYELWAIAGGTADVDDEFDPSEGGGGEWEFYTFDDGSTLTVGSTGNVSSTDATDTNYTYSLGVSALGCVTVAGAVIAAVASRGAATYGNAAAGAGSGCVSITRTPSRAP